ncbi:MAG: F0F1 ATP synthase subunit A [Anaerolineae bacterium]|nr:F0F1 ATP synthase subunit A [Anaerolineae bacterium]
MIRKIAIGSGIALVIIAIMIIGNILFPVDRAAIEIAAEPIFAVGPFIVTNAFFTSLILSIIILVVAFFIGRNLKEKPGGMQNIVEFLIESLDGLVTSLAPKKWGATFFPILATIFIYLLFANWFSLLTPLLGSFGFVHPTAHGGVPVENIIILNPEALPHQQDHAGEDETPPKEEITPAAESGLNVTIVPIFRAPSSDLNLTLGLALVTMVLVQVFGLREHGFNYIGHFIRLKSFVTQGVWMGLLDFLVGLIELVSEVFKIISFSFRLFGNIFAGEVVLIVITSLVSLLLVLVFFGLEIFVGLIQAFVFFILSLVFFSIATQAHEEH